MCNTNLMEFYQCPSLLFRQTAIDITATIDKVHCTQFGITNAPLSLSSLFGWPKKFVQILIVVRVGPMISVSERLVIELDQKSKLFFSFFFGSLLCKERNLILILCAYTFC